MESRKKSNDNYFGPKIKLFICVQAAAEAHIFLSWLPCQDVSRAGGEKNEKQREKIYEEINCEKSPYGIFPVLRAVHMMKTRQHASNHRKAKSLPAALSLSLSQHNFPFHFSQKEAKSPLRNVCGKCAWNESEIEKVPPNHHPRS
jgi:hypothetical protein